MDTITVTTKGRIVIPSMIRRRYDIRKGTKVYIQEEGDEIILRFLTKGYLEKMAGILNTKGRLTKAILKERTKEKSRER